MAEGLYERLEAPIPGQKVLEGEVVAVVGGFTTFAPLIVPSKYEILGDDMQILSVQLDLGEELSSAEINFRSFVGIHFFGRIVRSCVRKL